MYYEIQGTGKPLVLIHGTSGTIENSFGKVLPLFAKTRQVIAVEMQAHGHTADIDRPLTFDQMAEDTAALLRYLDIKSADVVGWSMETAGMHDAVVNAIRTTTPENVLAAGRALTLRARSASGYRSCHVSAAP